MKTEPNESAYPMDFSNEGFKMNEGLTKREYFASRMDIPNDELIDYAEIITGEKVPEGRTITAVKWWFETEAKLKVLKADALIEALNKEVKA